MESKRDLSLSFSRLGDIETQLGQLEKAREWYEKSFTISEQLAKELETIESRRNYSVCCERLGDIESQQGQLENARKWYEKSFAIREQIAKEFETVESNDNLAVSYYKLAWADPEKKQEYLIKAFGIWKALAEQRPHVAEFARRRDLALGALQN